MSGDDAAALLRLGGDEAGAQASWAQRLELPNPIYLSAGRNRDDDERARSRTSSMYKQQGERPVREVISTRATKDGTVTKESGSKPK